VSFIKRILTKGSLDQMEIEDMQSSIEDETEEFSSFRLWRNPKNCCTIWWISEAFLWISKHIWRNACSEYTPI